MDMGILDFDKLPQYLPELEIWYLVAISPKLFTSYIEALKNSSYKNR